MRKIKVSYTCRVMSNQLIAKKAGYGLDRFAYRPKKYRDPVGSFGLDVTKIPVLSEILAENAELVNSATMLYKKARAEGTVKNYQNTAKKFEKFCEKQGYMFPLFDEKAVLHWVLQLTNSKAALSTLCQVRPALALVEKLSGREDTAFSELADTLLGAAKRCAAERKPAVNKAALLPMDILKLMFVKVLGGMRCTDESKIDLADLRTLTRITVVYYTFCRFNCFHQLQARDFEDKGDSIRITFRSAKNDQMHKGNETYVVENDSTCPVYLLRLYFRICGFQFNFAQNDLSYVNTQVTRSRTGTWAPVKKLRAGYNQSTGKLQELMKKMGMEGKRVTDKSFKMLGVTMALENGLTLEEVMTQGRWRTLSMPLHYKVNSELYKKRIAAKVPS